MLDQDDRYELSYTLYDTLSSCWCHKTEDGIYSKHTSYEDNLRTITHAALLRMEDPPTRIDVAGTTLVSEAVKGSEQLYGIKLPFRVSYTLDRRISLVSDTGAKRRIMTPAYIDGTTLWFPRTVRYFGKKVYMTTPTFWVYRETWDERMREKLHV